MLLEPAPVWTPRLRDRAGQGWEAHAGQGGGISQFTIRIELRRADELQSRGGAWTRITGVRVGSDSPELVLADVNGGTRSFHANDASYDHQLHGRHVVQKGRPGNRDLDACSGGKRTVGFKQDAAAR
jgi:hypothetical protein